jgi:hypothetical protein
MLRMPRQLNDRFGVDDNQRTPQIPDGARGSRIPDAGDADQHRWTMNSWTSQDNPWSKINGRFGMHLATDNGLAILLPRRREDHLS